MDDDEFLSTDHEISLDRSVRVINQEIQWCYQHIDSNAEAARYQHRFIKGLEQAKYLLIAMAKQEAQNGTDDAG